jgi:hypothetical protein
MSEATNTDPNTQDTQVLEEHWTKTNEVFKADTEAQKALSKYKTPEDAIKGGLEAMKLVGRSVQIPGEKATDEEKAKFAAKIRQYQGIPDKPEDYKLTRPQMPEGQTYDEELERQAITIAHEEGISPKALQRLSDAMHQRLMAQWAAYRESQKKAEIEAQEKRTKETAAVLAEFDKDPEFKTKFAMVQHLLKKEGSIELAEELEANKGNNPQLIKFLLKMAPTHVAEGEITGGEGSAKTAQGILDYPEMR